MAHARKLSGMLPAALLLSLVSAFTLETEAAYAAVFYVAVPCSLVLARPQLPRDLGARLAATLIVWSALTLLWGDGGRVRTLRFALSAAATLVLLLALIEGLAMPARRHCLAEIFTGLAAASAAVALVRFLVAPSVVGRLDTPRLHGWGVTAPPVPGAAVTAMALVTALYVARGEHRRWALLAASVLAADLVLTKSRGPILAAAVSITFLLVTAGQWRRALAGACIAGLGWLLLPAQLRGGYIRAWEPGRLPVWQQTLREITERPLFGHGLGANLASGPGSDASFPHNLFLSLLFYSGAVGLALFCGLIALLAARLWQVRAEAETSWIAALGLTGLLAGLTDLGQITQGPGPTWLLIWLPVGLVLCLDARGAAGLPPAAGAVR